MADTMQQPTTQPPQTDGSSAERAERDLRMLAARHGLDRETALRLALAFAWAREQEFADYALSMSGQGQAPRSRLQQLLSLLPSRFDLTAFSALMFVIGMALSLVVIWMRK
jgi:hypothetical protein